MLYRPCSHGSGTETPARHTLPRLFRRVPSLRFQSAMHGAKLEANAVPAGLHRCRKDVLEPELKSTCCCTMHECAHEPPTKEIMKASARTGQVRGITCSSGELMVHTFLCHGDSRCSQHPRFNGCRVERDTDTRRLQNRYPLYRHLRKGHTWVILCITDENTHAWETLCPVVPYDEISGIWHLVNAALP
ncbi:uncharacterized protein BT62DRAFT_432947 [Guyanagaster necrorhizus]|uniref:Uncharacterized protein n=1 Tax=Guyanagaster necrorhizus TaxID=856835 RepID=A0A9P7W2M8_9AGAR|nr:uncharacterized protein BT62DRAFT_432947 [Guyanagaster necrorhizus MCA 3950]KAG7451558.1 hypothetical protein BT62DRAFT_432947 [Guyanagaster necrorhizus MCA 3950]